MATKQTTQECAYHQSLQISDTKYFFSFNLRETRISVFVTDILHSWHSDVKPSNVMSVLKIDSLSGIQSYLKLNLLVSTNVSVEGATLQIQVGTKPKLTLELTELSADSGRSMLSEVLANVSEQCHKLEKTCDTLQLKVSKLESDFLKGDTNHVPLPERKRGRQPKITRPEGSSLVNPSSKRKKVARGVTFDDN